MREIVMDTETTGLDPYDGHRIVEIGGVDLICHMPTGRTYHQYINPQRDMPTEAFEVHGISEEFLADKPVFAAIAQEFLDFIGDAFAHRKFLAYAPAADGLLVAAGVNKAKRDDGIVALSAAADADEFIATCRKLRFWPREQSIKPV